MTVAGLFASHECKKESMDIFTLETDWQKCAGRKEGGKRGNDISCPPAFSFFCRTLLLEKRKSQATGNGVRKSPAATLTGRYRFRQGNRSGVLRDTTVAGPGVHRESGDRHGVHGGRSGKPEAPVRSGWHSCCREVTGSVRKSRRECGPFRILPGYGRQRRSGFCARGSFSWLPTGKGFPYEGKHSGWNRYWPPVHPKSVPETGNRTGCETSVWQEAFSWSFQTRQKAALSQVGAIFYFTVFPPYPENLTNGVFRFFQSPALSIAGSGEADG